MELYKEYLLERENVELFYDEDSFVTYKLYDDYMYVIDIYVKPEARRKGKAFELGRDMDKLAKSFNYNKIMGSVCMSTNGWKISLEGLIKFGYSVDSVKGDMVYLLKDLNHGK
jgi:predicted GNAT superfamily acetyltransferase